jgi:hypothetical protein
LCCGGESEEAVLSDGLFVTLQGALEIPVMDLFDMGGLFELAFFSFVFSGMFTKL